jgi:hypothetical protein
VLVPLFDVPRRCGSAGRRFATALPGYEVIGFPWSEWYYYDALHCRTRAVFDRHMLRITHRRLDDVMPPAAAYPLTVTIDDRSETGLVADALRVSWRIVGSAPWNNVSLTPTATPDEYNAAIPGPAPGVTVEYYVSAADNSGRTETLPPAAPAGTYRFTVARSGLDIALDDPPATIAPWQLTTIDVTITPGTDVLIPDSPTLHYRTQDGDFLTRPLAHVAGDHWQATLPRMICSDAPEFYVTAAGENTGTCADPPAAPLVAHHAAVGTPVTTTLLGARFADGLPAGWTATGLWHTTSTCTVDPPCEAAPWAYFGVNSSCTYSTGQRASGRLAAPPVTVPAGLASDTVTITYCSRLQTENQPGYDVAAVLLNDAPLDDPTESVAWQTRTVTRPAAAGDTLVLAFVFDTIDDHHNDFPGWQVDDVRITADLLDCSFDLPYAIGDTNCDGVVSAADIDPFVIALTGGQAAFETEVPGCHFSRADCNDDGVVSAADIDAFVTLLTGG